MPQKKKDAHGAAIASGGAVVAGTGLAAGGIPGAKADSRPIFNLKPGHGGRVKRKVTAVTQNTSAAKAAKGGILGFRTHVHEGGTAGFMEQADKIASRPVAPGKEASHAFSHGYTSGKIGPELKIIRQMKGGKKAAGAALLGGAGTTGYGLKRAKDEVNKAERHADQYHGTLLGAGGAGLAVGAGGRKVLRGQEHKWRNRANTGIDEAQKLVPNLGGRKPDQNLKRYKKHLGRGGTPENFPKTMRPEREMTDILRDKKTFEGVSPETAKKAGALRGGAAQAEHFSHVYGSTAKVVGRLRGPSALVAGAGAGGLAATHMKDKRVKKNLSAFGVEH
jgi:hypothetical protein